MGENNVTNAADGNLHPDAVRGDSSRGEKYPELSEKGLSRAQDNNKNEKTDSPAAKEKKQITTYTEIINRMPDIREDVVARVKSNLQKGLYSDPEILRKTAERMLGHP